MGLSQGEEQRALEGETDRLLAAPIAEVLSSPVRFELRPKRVGQDGDRIS